MRLVLTAFVCLLAAAGPAFAHGGQYRGGGGPSSGPSVPPGPADRPAPTTTWETWWSANKEFHLRLHERMRGEGEDVTPTGERARTRVVQREAEDAARREELLPVFLDALHDDSFEVRTAAAIALGKLGAPEAVAPLRVAQKDDPHNDVRDAALLATGMLRSEANLPFLLEVLQDPANNARHRGFAAFGIGMYGGDDAAMLLVRFLQGGGARYVGGRRVSPVLLASVYVALGLTGSAQALEPLREAAAGDDDELRAYAILALGRLGDRAVLEDVVGYLKLEKDANVRRSSAITLGKLAHSDDAEAVSVLFAALDDREPLTRHFAAVALGGIADAPQRERLAREMVKAPTAERPFYALALGIANDGTHAPLIRKLLAAERDENIRGGYCIALGLLGDVTAVPLLEQAAAERGEIWLPGYAALSLGMVGSRSSAALLRERLATANDPRLRMNIAIALGLLHDERAKIFLTQTVSSRDATVYERGSAAMSLGVLRLNEAVPDLLAVYRDTKQQEMVRAMSVVALGVLADPSPVGQLTRFSIDNNYGLGNDPLNEVLSIL